ncbi:unnamed protein product, partial [Choristocarpus tenellus]
QGHKSPVCALQADDQRLVSASVDGMVIAWDLGSGREMFRIGEHYPSICSLQFDLQHLVTDGTNEFLVLHDFSGVRGVAPELIDDAPDLEPGGENDGSNG